MRSARAGDPEATAGTPLVELDRADASLPLLVAGLSGWGVLSGSGELALRRETRGGDVEWGGVYGQGVRLTGPWSVRLSTPSGSIDLPSSLRRLTARREVVESEHVAGGLRILQEFWTAAEFPGLVRRLRLVAETERLPVRVETEFAPFLGPVLIEGVKPYDYRAETRGTMLRVSSHGFGFAVETDPLPSHLAWDGTRWIGGRREGEVARLGLVHELTVGAGVPATLSWAVWGGLEHTIEALPAAGRATLEDPERLRSAESDRWSAWLAATPEVSLPEAPALQEGYRLARSALRSLYARPEPGLTGLVAGHPWYSALWCRDLAWMLPAVLWMGDASWAEESIRTAFRFQARARLPILAAEAGELPMQLSPGPIFLYGTSDTTLYYPGLLRRLRDHTGSDAAAEALRPQLERLLEWTRLKAEPASGLFRNGSEVGELTEEAEEVGRVHLGFDAVDTTIWDSTDRRDHAVDLQVLYVEALEALGDLLGTPGAGDETAARSARVRAAVRERYRWEEEGYLYDSLLRDGTPVPRLRPNALRAVSAGLLDPAFARRVVQRAARDDLTASWGVRTLSSLDPGFDPRAYHDGQVWTIATAWAADAALRVGETDLGAAYLATNAGRLVEEHGLANECYRGDRDEPFNSCFLLGFSVAPFLTTIFDTLFGIVPDARRRCVRLEPRFPGAWRSASVHGLRLAGGRLDLDWSPEGYEALWEGPGPLEALGRGGAVTLTPGRRARVPDLANRPSS